MSAFSKHHAAHGASAEAHGDMRFSIVIPVLNEQDNILPLLAEIEVLAAPPEEVLVVDDGSTDATPERLQQALMQYPRLRVLRHGRRLGQSAGIRSGVQAARSPWVVTMDGDGQNDPADVARLVDAARVDRAPRLGLVAGLRQVRRDSWSRRAASRIANRARNAVLRDGCPDTGCSLKLFARDAYLALPFFSGQHRFLPALFLAAGYRAVYVPVSHRPRRSGTTKYANLPRAAQGIVDMLGVLWLRRRTPAEGVVEEIAPKA
jgi:dolichol-phosphate mannosyltransferase